MLQIVFRNENPPKSLTASEIQHLASLWIMSMSLTPEDYYQFVGESGIPTLSAPTVIW